MKMYSLKPLSVCDTNSFIIESEKGNAVLIDAPADPVYILSEIKKHGVNLKKILLTHGHFDHIGALADVAQQTGSKVYIHENDIGKLTDDKMNLLRDFEGEFKHYENAIAVRDGDVITLDELEFKVLHTPGHTSGCVCYICEDCMFSGDTLFAGSMGRTDRPDGDIMVMIGSLQKLAAIDENYKVYPGHMNETTLEHEKKYNPYLSRFV